MPDAEAFSDYARIYDAIYADKDYAGEAEFVLARLRGAGGSLPSTLLDVGSGTGRHLREFARRGIRVVGVDRSREMTAIARDRIAADGTGSEVVVDDIRSFALGRRFAAACSLFHVVSYLTTVPDLAAAFAAVRRHLDPGARFFFDFWHLPGVRLDPPGLRERRFVTAEGSITRRMVPRWREPVVTLDIEIDGDLSGRTVRIREAHALRAWLPGELAGALASSGFAVASWGGGLEARPLGEPDWLGWALAEAT
jgi:SAM-dependent methyltransferase